MNEIAKQLFENQENIILIYAFNATGKTRLSVAYKNFTKNENDGNHTGVYYNAFSEDLFVWENDEINNNENLRLNIINGSLNQFHSFLDEKDIEEKLAIYNPKFKFSFNLDENPERGIESITFFIDEENQTPIKISRGEERIFVWCFFLALFEVDAWAGSHDAHFFIDDPVSSLDEHNIFITAESIFGLIEEHYLKKRIIITTHHIGLFSILFDKLKKGEKSGRYNKLTKPFILNSKNENLVLNSLNNDVFLFHLHLIQTIDTALKTELYAYHFVLLRQLLENISSFLGVGRVGYTLEQIGIEKVEAVSNIINSLSHKNAYRLQFNKLAEAEENVFKDVFRKLQVKYRFIY
ncbi:AAA domain-containing protein [Mucilaginibacter pineti]|uniref:AAA domain-containing protein n=1 Tax=Mucilaginibacter pineti TaxID=1391627 RepID=A0A1G7GC64_9SPHI|nr:AAA family ATPase [Mucilaginibacter pineti]SDE85732.1 AAA domain-containing protein [Mucilaginibacter pineti]